MLKDVVKCDTCNTGYKLSALQDLCYQKVDNCVI